MAPRRPSLFLAAAAGEARYNHAGRWEDVGLMTRESDEVKELLAELRDVQREHLDEYRKVTQRSLELQR
jgi:hypothetical protein